MSVLKNSKHEAVLQAFLADPKRVGWRAYKSVYRQSSQRAAETGWSRLLKTAEFAGRLAELDSAVTEKVVERSAMTIAEVVDELAKLGRANMQDYMIVGADGQPTLDWSKLTRNQAAALSAVEVETNVIAGKEDAPALTVRKVKFKLHDKRAALVSIGEHLGAFKRKVEHSGPDGGAIPLEDKTPKDMSELDLARRIAFILEQGARANAKAAPPKGKKARAHGS